MDKDYAKNVLTFAELRKRLSPDASVQLQQAQTGEGVMSPELADEVARAMLDWSLERGVTHYCHWFQPLNGATAEKHEAFLGYDRGGRLISKFSGSSLIKGEADASSLPHGSTRSTFEARGYTVWDVNSEAFVKDGDGARVLCIPTAYCSYVGDSLDEKTPVIRATARLQETVRRLFGLLGMEARRVQVKVGLEQEYFLIDRQLFMRRPDLVQCNRTLFGCPPARATAHGGGQYYAAIRPRVLRFMSALNAELAALGVPAKTQHNEVAPAQHELAVLYADASRALEHNQLVMECMRRVAEAHGLACLLHEKPFAGVNGSGKHTNWSVVVDGVNVFDPNNGLPRADTVFRLFFTAVVAACDKYGEVLLAAAATPGNEHRLGGSEAPPRILSVSTGAALARLGESGSCVTPVGAPGLAPAAQDGFDRNRTAPMAFTGDKFEFRAPGAAQSAGLPLCVLLAGLVEQLEEVCI